VAAVTTTTAPPEFALLVWLRVELARFTYKPGWVLAFEPPPEDGGRPSLVVDFVVQDSYHPGREIPIHSRRQVPEHFTELPEWQRPEVFARWLGESLRRVEEHESREWLRRDGQVFDDPHAGGRSSL
jgi:hypothetical protein